METTNNEMRNSEEQDKNAQISTKDENLTTENTSNLEDKSIDEKPTSNTMNEITENNEENINNVDVSESVEEKTTEEIIEDKKTEVKSENTVTTVVDEVEAKKSILLNTNFSALSNLELVNTLEEIISTVEIQRIKAAADAIKSVFYINLRAETQKLKEAFDLEQKEKEEEEREEFKPEPDELSIRLKELLSIYREKKAAYHKEQDEIKNNNLSLKKEIIKKIENLVNSTESTNNTFNEFRELQRQWKEIGLIPQEKVNEMWQNYHMHVENFYNYIKINKELRDLDLKKNFEAKIKLCEQAEELFLKDSILDAFNMLQEYHNVWREIGPVPLDKKEEIWDRFKEATKHINKKHQDYYTELKKEQENNLEAKNLICKRSEEISVLEINVHKDWEANTKEIIELQKLWKSIGMVPRKDNDRIFKAFRAACNLFFDKKKEFYSKIKEIQNNNLQLKTELCIQAEGMQDSKEWKKTSSDFINLQKKWKEIGTIPNKVSEQIWKRFRSACDVFFNNKNEYFGNLESDQKENLEKKKTLLEKIKAFTPNDNDQKADIETLKNIQTEWNEIGHVPFKAKDSIQKEYREAISEGFKKLNIDASKLEMLQFKNRISSYGHESNSTDKLENEKTKVFEQMKRIEADIKLWENNIGFFSNSSKAESLLKDIYSKIENAKEKLKTYKSKIKMINESLKQ